MNDSLKESVYKLFVGGIRDITTTDSLRDEFSQFGTVKHVELMMDKVTGRHRGFAFVTYEDFDSVDKAVSKYRCGEFLFSKQSLYILTNFENYTGNVVLY